MFQGFGKVWLLSASAALCFSALPLMSLMGSLLGAELAPTRDWATLPVAAMVVGTAVSVVPASSLMRRYGRRPVFFGAGLVAVMASLLAGQALVVSSFTLLVVAGGGLGAANAIFQQYRFAAMETVDGDRGPMAASIIMIGSIFAAFMGPELAVLGRHISDVEYLGSFWLAAVTVGAGATLVLFFQIAPANTQSEQTREPRPWAELLKSPSLLLALASATVGFAVMAFVMTGTPISMHHHHGHSLEDTKWVIQSHIAAMFLPSLLTVWLFRVISVRALMILGLCCYAGTITIGLVDVSVLGFWGQLVMLGVGWNFLFVAGTALLPTTHLPGEQYRAQALNDTVVFSTQASASLLAGIAVAATSWQNILLGCLVPIALLAGLFIYESWSRPVRGQ